MTTVEITLPDDLAEQARSAGVLSQERLEGWVREELRAQAARELSRAMDKMHSARAVQPMSPEQLTAEIAQVRAHKRSGPSS